MRRGVIVVLLCAITARAVGQDEGLLAREPEIGSPTRPGPPRIVLLPRVPIARAGGWIVLPEPSPDDREEEAEAALEAYFDGVLMRDQIEAGRVDGWYYEASQLMRARFRPDREAVVRERRAGMNPVQVLRDELSRYAAPRDRPSDLPIQDPLARMGWAGDPYHRQFLEGHELCAVPSAPTTWHRVVLRVTHNPEGDVSAVWVEHTSGSRSLDRSALRAVREGAVMLPPPPPLILGQRQAIQSDWAFEMGDVAIPIHCGIVCTDDPVLGPMCSIGGRGIIRTRLSLLRVLDEQHPSPAERRAARRRDRDRPRP
jgi:TonB family protein